MQWTRFAVEYVISILRLSFYFACPTSAMRVKAPSAGICTFSALLESECFILLFSNTDQNRFLEPPPFSDRPTATCAPNAVSDPLSGRHAARSRAAVAASNQPIFLYVSNVRAVGRGPAAGPRTTQAPCSVRILYRYISFRFPTLNTWTSVPRITNITR